MYIRLLIGIYSKIVTREKNSESESCQNRQDIRHGVKSPCLMSFSVITAIEVSGGKDS